MAVSIMVQGTASHVGKSLIATGLCRWLSNHGYRVAPFKAQNMSLNSTATPDGREISWSQALQAEAARVVPTSDMNPVLLKPSGPSRSQVVLQGRVLEEIDARAYFMDRKERLWTSVEESYRRLAACHDVIVIEGAGSPVEMNLKAHDIVNMRVAEMADAAVLLVADIERGGVFASLVGTWALLEPGEQERVAGFVINKFRGDRTLFQEGERWLEERLGVPVWGVVPYLDDLDLEEEDSLGLRSPRYRTRSEPEEATLQIVAVRLPYLANFMDIDPLFRDPRVAVRWATRPGELQAADAIILPGTKNTMADLAWLDRTGFAAAIRAAHVGGAFVLGICGGYQMLGARVEDPHHVEGSEDAIRGLGLINGTTVLTPSKRTRAVTGALMPPFPAGVVRGYEIHMGTTAIEGAHRPLLHREGGPEGLVMDEGRVIGTYVHGILDNGPFTEPWLAEVARARHKTWTARSPREEDGRVRRERAYDRLALTLDEALGLARLEELISRRR
ncbi:MAG: cobyric acid synthase [Clostridia bacterium]